MSAVTEPWIQVFADELGDVNFSLLYAAAQAATTDLRDAPRLTYQGARRGISVPVSTAQALREQFCPPPTKPIADPEPAAQVEEIPVVQKEEPEAPKRRPAPRKKKKEN